ncbi:unnamed protein product [Strongylus vulgaris]|uniref:Uncharacterized protein n=1 Tax=Strongylus vulgaris TaxID=40348 RepID=A0A3P7JU87_STRVU|nr:unnamed protein product [Strongylus vulgaris]
MIVGITKTTGKNGSNLLDNLYYKDNSFSVEVRDPRSKQIADFNGIGVPLTVDEDLAQAVNDPTTQ